MYEVFVIENAAGQETHSSPLAVWTEVFETPTEAEEYMSMIIKTYAEAYPEYVYTILPIINNAMIPPVTIEDIWP